MGYVRNHRYKLYDDGRFYDIEKDVLEKNPLRLTRLKGEELAVGKMLQKALDQMPGLN